MTGSRPFAPLGRGVLYNLAGVGAPAVMALLALPLLARTLGAERFGVLALAWSSLGYLALLNLGIGRALVQASARRGDAHDLPELVWTALVILTGLGLVGGATLFAIAPRAPDLLNLHGALARETTAALRVLAAAVPFTVSAAAFTAVLEARRRFGALNAVSVPLSAFNFLGPILALQVGEGLVPVMGVLLAGRIAGWCASLLLCIREVPAMGAGISVKRRHVRPLLAFGGWVTVSQLVSPLMVFGDRFVIAGVVSAGAVAYYATPQEAMLRLGGVAGAVAGVLFPAFSAGPGPARSARLMHLGVASVYLGVFPLALVMHVFASEILTAWMGAGYAAEGAAVLRWLALGLLVNGLARVPASLLLGRGRPDVPGQLHLAQLPLYAIALWVLVSYFGVTGAAIAWLLRASVDTAALYWIASRVVPERSALLRRVALLAGGGGALMVALAAIPHPWARAAAVAASLAAFAALGWSRLLGPDGRAAVRAALALPAQRS